MKHKTLALQTDAETDMAIIDKELYSILKGYNVQLRSGPRFVRINIIADVSIIIKMLNTFVYTGNSYILYVYLYSNKNRRYVYSQAIQYGLSELPVEAQLREATKHIADISIQMLEAYGYRTDHFSIDNNLEDENIFPSKCYKKIHIDKESIGDKITFIVDTIINELDIYTDNAYVSMHYHINIGDPEYEADVTYNVLIQYSEIFHNDMYSIRFSRPDDTYDEYAMDVNEFTDYMYQILTYLYNIVECKYDDEIGEITLYILDSVSIEHM